MIIYLIFTTQGFEDIKQSLLADETTLWVNPDILSDNQLAQLAQQNIVVHTLANKVDPSNEKSVMAAIEYIETDTPNAELFVECL